MTQILDPTDERVPIRRSLARRDGQIDRAVALLDIRKPRGDVLLDHLELRLQDRVPGIDVRRYAKPTFTRPAPLDLRRQIAQECGFVVEALAD